MGVNNVLDGLGSPAAIGTVTEGCMSHTNFVGRAIVLIEQGGVEVGPIAHIEDVLA